MGRYRNIDYEKKHALEVMLKKLGVSNVDEHIQQMSREMRSNSSRKNRQSSSKTVEKLKKNSDVMKDLGAKPKRKYNKKIKIIENKEDKSSKSASLSSMMKMAKNRKRTSESEDDGKKQSNRKKFLSVDSNPSSCASSQYGIEEDEDFSQVDENCTFPGCDSSGHLSGAFNFHTSNETCPRFHNQTNEDCLKRFKHRREMYRKKKSSKTSSKSPTKRSPSKKAILKTRNLKNDQTWMKIMDERKKEMLYAGNGFDACQTSPINSEPKLEGFTPKFDLELFKESQSRAAELMHFNLAGELRSDKKSHHSDDEDQDGMLKQADQTVVFGQYELDVWYQSPYSNEFQNCKTLFICEFCLKCMSSPLILERHALKCQLKHPPGKEIYRKDEISFFEVDGNQQKEYCQNLCLFAKLFLNHKTLFFDVEPFLFYIMTVSNDTGMHIVGYFSKEKFSSRDYNVSCILTIPAFQRSGYGRMLIDFSYLLTRAEGKVGSPETPISDLGIISYRSYWKFIIMDYLSTFKDKNISLKDMSQQTGINANDIVSTLQLMGLLKYWKGEHLILVPDDIRNKFLNEVKKKRKQFGKKVIDAKQLNWTKPVFT